MSSSLTLFILFSNWKGLNDFSPKFATCIDLIWIISSFSPCTVYQDIRGPAGLNLLGLNLEVSGPAGFNLVSLNLEFSGPTSLETPPKENCNKEKIAYLTSYGPPKAPGPLVTTMATPLLDGPVFR